MMKSEKLNGGKAVIGGVTNVEKEAEMVLKTMLLLETSFGVNYLSGILVGYPIFRWRHEHHGDLETVGCLRNRSRSWVNRLIHWMADEGLVEARQPNCSVIEITDQGKKFLEKTYILEAPNRILRTSRYDFMLATLLRKVRKDVASVESMPYYMVFSNFTLERIVRDRPTTYDELKEIPGMNGMKADKYGVAIMHPIFEIAEIRREETEERLRRRVAAPTYQSTKAYFQEGLPIEEIAEAKGVKTHTIVRYLSQLHIAGELDINPWIEEYVDSKVLYAGAEYFRKEPNQFLGEARNVLGFDYDTLRLCRIYAAEDIPSGELKMQA